MYGSPRVFQCPPLALHWIFEGNRIPLQVQSIQDFHNRFLLNRDRNHHRNRVEVVGDDGTGKGFHVRVFLGNIYKVILFSCPDIFYNYRTYFLFFANKVVK